MKQKFKVGDKVTRTDSDFGEAIMGRTYTVAGVDGNSVWLKELTRTYSYAQGAFSFAPIAYVRKTRNGQFRFVLKAPNGEIVSTSETYTTKAMAKKTLSKYFSQFEVVEEKKRK